MRVKCFELMILLVFDLHVEVLLIKKCKRTLIVKLTYMISYTKMLHLTALLHLRKPPAVSK